MSDSKAKMLQIRFRLGLRSRPHLGSLSAPPDPLAELRGQLLKGGDGRGRVSPSPAPSFKIIKPPLANMVSLSIGGATPKFLGGQNLRPTTDVLHAIDYVIFDTRQEVSKESKKN